MTEERITSKGSKSHSLDEEHVRRTSAYIRKTQKGKWLYRYMHLLLFVEGLVWEVMDAVRAHRMSVAERITKHKHTDRV